MMRTAKPMRVPVGAMLVIALVAALVMFAPSAAQPKAASAAAVQGTQTQSQYCAFPTLPNCGTGYTGYGNCQAGYVYTSLGCQYVGGTTTYGSCTYGSLGCVNGVCSYPYVSNGYGSCINNGSTTYGSCTYGSLGCVN